jgi:hypothetical protein
MGNTMNANDLNRILNDAKQFRSKDATFPALGVVRLETRGGNIIAVATDRYTLGVSRADYAGEEFTANLGASTVDNLLRIAKTASRAASWRTVDIEIPEHVREGEAKTVAFIFSTGEQLTVTCDDSQFPAWRQILPDERIYASNEVSAVAGYTASRLAQFAKVSGADKMRLFHRGLNKPAVVKIGDDFVGLVMQSRIDQAENYGKPSWIGV